MFEKVQYNKSFGLDLTQVVAWKLVRHQDNPMVKSEDWDLEVYTSGNTILIEKSTLSEEDFKNLVERLVKKFSPSGFAMTTVPDQKTP